MGGPTPGPSGFLNDPGMGNNAYTPGDDADAATATTLVAAPSYPESVSQPVGLTLTATVTESPMHPPTGSVYFYDNGVMVGMASVGAGGVATWTVANPAGGVHVLTAVYSGNVPSERSESNPVSVTVAEDLAAQQDFAAALLAAARTYENAIVWEDGHTGSSGAGAAGGQPPPANPFLADKPTALSDAELTRLEGLVKKGLKASGPEGVDRDKLVERLKAAGVQFDGLDALQTLDRILKAGQRGLKGDPRKEFLKFYRDGLEVAIRGLATINEGRYQLYHQGRRNGATHEDAWLFDSGGPTALRRYELERMIGEAK